tara:strand:+ start:792 stop:1670 length:879 start_codon:yes stop_codon:yes gene_type:complete
MKNTTSLFFFGFGQVAKSFVSKLKTEKTSFKITVTTREETKDKIYNGIPYKNFQLDENKFDRNLIKGLEQSDHILISIPPVNEDDITLKYFKEIFKNKKFKWVTYLSATSVYGNHNGEWVDESSSTKPKSSNGIARLKAEKLWIEFANEYNLQLQIFRLSGIYSSQNNVLKRLKTGDVKIVKKKNQFFSRIHVEDIANILFKSLKNFKKGEIYNISDDKPASMEEVIDYGIKLIGTSKPKTIKIEEIESEMLKNFYKESKKVKNKKMKDFFKYNLKYPSYIEGLNYIYNNSV